MIGFAESGALYSTFHECGWSGRGDSAWRSIGSGGGERGRVMGCRARDETYMTIIPDPLRTGSFERIVSQIEVLFSSVFFALI